MQPVLCFLSVVVAQATGAQPPVTLSGQIVYKEKAMVWGLDGPNIEVQVTGAYGQRFSATSDKDGGFEMRLPKGAFTVSVSHKGIKTAKGSLRILGSGLRSVTILVRPDEDSAPSQILFLTRPVVRQELLEHVAKDQDVRNKWIQAGTPGPSARATKEMAQVDAANCAYISRLFDRSGWPTVRAVSQDGSNAAFLMLQHAPIEVQDRYLSLVDKAFKRGDVPGTSYAILVDRIRVRHGKKQIYGSQASPVDRWVNGEPSIDPIEDPEHVDERRARMGLGTLAAYKEFLKNLYRKKS